MGLSREVVQGVLLLAILEQAVGFVRLDTTAMPPENPSKRYIENITLSQLTSDYLTHLSPDITLLKISDSRMDRIEKTAFDHLTHLNLLEVSDCEIRQELDPQTFSRLPGLELLILKHIGLKRVNLNLTNVQELILAENKMETFDGRTITGRNINFLNLSGNKLKLLTGTFSNMSKLSILDISRNKIREVPPVFQENNKLLRILASENKITSTDGLKLPWLRTLDLFANEIQELHQDSFSWMTSLEELVLAFNLIRHVEDPFSDLVELKYLNLAWNHIQELPPGLFRNNLYLTKLSLQGNKITSLEKFQNVLPHLTYLDLSHNHLAQVHEEFFRSTPALQVLDLSFNVLTSLSGVLSPLPEVTVLNLAYNRIVMSGNELSANHKLTRVNLSSNALQGGLVHFRNNSLLSELDLSYNQIRDLCDADVELKSLLKVNLRGNEIKSVSCLNYTSLCEVDIRNNPLSCGEELNGLILSLAKRRGAPYRLREEVQTDFPSSQCEKLSLENSFHLWNSVKRELCPHEEDVHPEASEEWSSVEEEGREVAAESFEVKAASGGEEMHGLPHEQKVPQKMYIIKPIAYIKNDEMNKPNPLQRPQSGRVSWGSIDENSKLLNGFEEEEIETRPRFSWYTIALILIGLSLTLTCFNLVVFLYIRLKVWKRADSSSPQKYTALQNEVYKNTTEPSKGGEEWPVENGTRNKVFSYGKINEILLNFGPRRKDKDSESAKNILIHSTNGAQNF